MILRAVRTIFSAYRRDDFADPESFVVQLGVILERYSDAVIGTVSRPLTGIQRRCKFPPSIAEVVEACDQAADSERRLSGPRVPFHRERPIVKRHRANVLVHLGTPQHAAMVARSRERNADPQDYRTDDERGIWVSVAWLWDLDDRRGAKPVGRVAAQVARR